MYATPAPIFRQLFESLEKIRFDDQLVAEPYAIAVVSTFLSTPFIDPLDDFTYEMLLAFSGLDLNNANEVAFAASFTEFLIGTGHFNLSCSHGDDPSPLCLRLTSGVDAHQRSEGETAADAGRFDEALAIRDVRYRKQQQRG